MLREEISSDGFVRRPWCARLAVGLVLLGAVLNVIYLFWDCPIDLSEDESHYWEWSRHLDYGYYSKPPGIAWVIWAAIRVGGWFGVSADAPGTTLMPVMRMAAIVFGVMSGLLSLFLARRVFRDDRAALAVIVLSAAVPMFAVGSLLITIDSPMYLSWAGAVYCLWRVVEASGQASVVSGQEGAIRWLYLAGICSALGMMFKPVLVAIPFCVLVGMWADAGIRRAFKAWHSVGALGVLLLSQVPVVIWNWHHNWVTFRHIGTQAGIGGLKVERTGLQTWLLDPLKRLGEYVGGQAGGMGGILFVLLVIGVVVAWRKVLRAGRGPASANVATAEHARTRWAFLLSFAVPLWGFYFVLNFRKETEVNWPAASYFAAMILLAGILVEDWNAADAKFRRGRRILWMATIIWGVLLTSVVKNTHWLYPAAAARLEPLRGSKEYSRSNWHPRLWDKPILDKLRGMHGRAMAVQQIREQLHAEKGEDPMIISARYGSASSLAIYLPGHPFVFSIMSNLGERQSQYDIWPGVNEKEAEGGGGELKHKGRAAVIVGDISDAGLQEVLVPAFERVDPPVKLPVVFEGVIIKDVVVRKAYGFRGMPGGPGGVY